LSSRLVRGLGSTSSPSPLLLAVSATLLASGFIIFRYNVVRSWKLSKRQISEYANHGSIGDSRPIAFSGYARGHSVETETWRRSILAYLVIGYSPSNLRASLTDQLPKRCCIAFVDRSCRPQATCKLSFLGSKRSPFFQTVKVMAAIFRARVKRAAPASYLCAAA
jgi:hypothetical protein